MFNILQTLSPLAIIVSGLAFVALGFIWYSPAVFGRPWAHMMGFNMGSKEKIAEMQKKAVPAYFASFIGALVQAAAISVLMHSKPGISLSQAALFGALLWLGFQAPFSLSGVLYAQKPIKLWAIDAGYQLCGLIIAAMIIQIIS